MTVLTECVLQHFQKKLSAITSTIRNVATDLVHLFFVLALAIQLFAFIAMIVFGDELLNFNTYGDASFNLWLMTLKIFEFEEKDHEFVDSSHLYYFRIFFEVVIMTGLMKMVIGFLIGQCLSLEATKPFMNSRSMLTSTLQLSQKILRA